MNTADTLTDAARVRRRLCASLMLMPLAFAIRRGSAASKVHDPHGWGVDLSSIDPAIGPGEDFYQYVNSGWLSAATKPAGYTQYGELNAMFLRTEARIRTIIERAASEPAGSSKLADLYTSYADVAAIDRRGLQPIRADLDAILAITSLDQVARRMAHPMSHTIAGTYVFLDAGDTRQSLLHIDQQAANRRVIGLPSAQHYASGDETHVRHRLAYQDYIAQTLGRAGIGDGANAAAGILELEGRLASGMWNSEQLRDRKLNYHRMSIEGLEHYAPGFPWHSFLQATGYPPVTTVVLNTDTAIQAAARIFSETPVRTWRAYLAFHWIHNHAHLLPTEFQEASFQFYGTVLHGLTSRRSRADRGIQFVSQNLPELVGAKYVETFFKTSDRDAMEAMAPFMKQAFRARIERADWLDDAMRTTALSKLDAMDLRLGYPDDLRDYAEVEISPTDPIGNLHRLKMAQVELDARYLADPDRPYRWHLPPQSVDGSYSPQLNCVTFPAALLQQPAFDATSDSAVNFGAIGAVLGHEMAHGFDDQGSRFDEHGNLRDWWTPLARTAFDARTRVLVEQYSGYEPLPGMQLDGRRSLGENLADLVGVTVALDAYRLHAAANAIDVDAVRDGFTGEQRFFLGWAQLWRTLHTESALKSEIEQGYHSPARYRVNGVVRNLDAWYDAFDIGREARMFLPPADRASVW